MAPASGDDAIKLVVGCLRRDDHFEKRERIEWVGESAGCDPVSWSIQESMGDLEGARKIQSMFPHSGVRWHTIMQPELRSVAKFVAGAGTAAWTDHPLCHYYRRTLKPGRGPDQCVVIPCFCCLL